MSRLKCIDILIEEHKLILRAMNVLDEMAAQVGRGLEIESFDIESSLRFLKLFADDRHQGKEECVLFPALRCSALGCQEASLRHMVFEHDQERSLIEGMEEAMKTKRGADFVYYESRLAAILKNHIYKEENILFEIVESSFSETEDDAVTRDFAEFDRAVESETMDTMIGRLRDLEWKYLRRAA